MSVFGYFTLIYVLLILPLYYFSFPEFVPYVFQLISVMLEQYPLSQTVLTNCKLPQPVINGMTTGTPSNFRPSQAYSALLQRILVPSLWEPNRNVPSLVRLLQAYLLHNMDDVLAANKVIHL